MALIYLIAGCVFFVGFGISYFLWQTSDRRGRSPEFRKRTVISSIASLVLVAVCLVLFLLNQPSAEATSGVIDEWTITHALARRYWYSVSRLIPNSRARAAFCSPAAALARRVSARSGESALARPR